MQTNGLKNEGGTAKAHLKVIGMTCSMCSSTIQDSLSSVKGVKSAEVNLANETASIEYEPGAVTHAKLAGAVREAGYDIVVAKAIIRVGGMTCSMCQKTVGESLSELDGVISVSVNLASEKAYVDYIQDVVTLVHMKKAIEEAGYQYLGAEGQESEELEKKAWERDLRSKLIRISVGFAAGIPLMVLMYISIPGLEMHDAAYLQLAIAAPAFAFISYPIFSAAYRALRMKNLTMDVMYSMGIGVAFASSVMGTFEIMLTHEFLFYESAVLLATFLMLGRYLEARAKSRTSDAIKKLMGLQAKDAFVERDGREERVPITDVIRGDTVVVKPGSQVPVDGEVVSGESYVDESMITGEPIPVRKTARAEVVGGTINGNGVLRIKATRVGGDTVLSQIIRLVEQAQGSKPPVQRMADKVVAWFIPAILTVAIITSLAWYFLFHATILFALTTLISILVIACPCALGLATPTAVTVGIGRAAELGVLIKDGSALESSEKVSTVVFDKTGTLTLGKPEVTDIHTEGVTEKELLEAAAAVERNSQHPLAEAVVRKAASIGISPTPAESFATHSGMGVSGNTGGKDVLVGTRQLMSKHGIIVSSVLEEKITALESEAKTTVIITSGGKTIGALALADSLKSTSRDAVRRLQDMGIEAVMITGDNERTARAIAREAGITTVVAGVLPGDKASHVKKMQENGKKVAFVGDGINDAPALAQADVGIAIGSGTDVAIESADVVLIRSDPGDACTALQVGRKVMSRIRQNLFWAFAYNLALIPVAAGVLMPIFGIAFRPELAGLAMALSSVTVVSLSLMLRGYTPDGAFTQGKKRITGKR